MKHDSFVDLDFGGKEVIKEITVSLHPWHCVAAHPTALLTPVGTSSPCLTVPHRASGGLQTGFTGGQLFFNETDG